MPPETRCVAAPWDASVADSDRSGAEATERSRPPVGAGARSADGSRGGSVAICAIAAGIVTDVMVGAARAAFGAATAVPPDTAFAAIACE